MADLYEALKALGLARAQKEYWRERALLCEQMIDWMLTEMPVGWEEMAPSIAFIKLAEDIRMAEDDL